jgi:NAD(P)-dependent dehydrogenase (short-subunit alcohol dehydrogenase family)
MAARRLVELGHDVLLHARNRDRARDAARGVPGAGGVLIVLDVVLAFAIARRWPETRSNAVEPGWVATKMGGPGAPDDLSLAPETQVWLAVSDDPRADVTGRLFYHQREQEPHPAARDVEVQEQLLSACERLTGVALEAGPAGTQLGAEHRAGE